MNEIGEERRSRFLGLWKELDLTPQYVHSKNENIETVYPFFSQSLNLHMTGLSGCLKSHRKAWKLFLESECDFALITEDDAIPSPKLRSEITKIETHLAKRSTSDFPTSMNRTNQLPKPTYIQLGWYSYPRLSFRQFIVAGFHLVKYRGPVRNGYVRGHGFANHCYLINREMASFLLDKLSSEGLPLDLQLMTFARHNAYNECDILRSCQNYASQEGLDSSIHSGVTPAQNTSISRILVWVQSLADAKGSRFTI
jgi:GR25 family glycosyltransferase involved in LPS biosynthesis